MNTQVHDYRNGKRRWGHDITYRPLEDEPPRLSAMGWGRGLRRGDYVLLTGPDGGPSPYRIQELRYVRDPEDMWSAVMVYTASPIELARISALREGGG